MSQNVLFYDNQWYRVSGPHCVNGGDIVNMCDTVH